MESKEISTYEQIHRNRRVMLLIEVFRLARWTIEQVEMLDENGWKLAAICAGITSETDPKEPSETTRQQVIDTMLAYAELPKRKINATKARQILGNIDKPKPPKKRRR